MNHHCIALMLTLAVSSAAVADDPSRVTGPSPTVPADLNSFSVELLGRLAPATAKGNLVISPHGVSRVLAMAAEGATGPTADEIRRIGRLPASAQLLGSLDPSRPRIRPSLGASLIANGGYGLKVDQVPSGSSSSKAGLMVGDLILTVNDRPVRSTDRLVEALELTGVEGQARLQYYSFETGKVVEQVLTPDRVETPSSFLARDAAFLQRGLKVRPEFQASLDTIFHAPIITVDFASDPASAGSEIRRWVESTGKTVPSPDLSGLDASARLVLIDALSFEADWLHPFEPETPGRFTRLDGSTTEVPMLERTGRYAIDLGTDGSSLLEIPYADKTSALILLLPPPGVPIRSVLGSAKPGEIERRRAALKPRKVEVRLPSFRVETTSRLEGPLMELGIRLVFGPKAEFSNLVTSSAGRDEPIKLATILQTTTLEVTARGTKAGAVTTATAVALGVDDDPIPFHADRPFAFFLVDLSTGLIVFEGIVEDPTRPR